MKYLIYLVSITIITSSCDKLEVTDHQKSNEYNPLEGPNDDTELNGLITIMSQKAYRPNSPNTGTYNYSVNGLIKNDQYGTSSSQTIDAGALLLNNDAIFKDTNNIWHDYNYSNGSNLFGTTVSIEISGNPSIGINQTSSTLYFPKELELLNTSTQKALTKTGNNIFNWTPDPNYSGKVFVKVTYKGTMSNDKDGNLPNTDVVFSDDVDDSQGSYTLMPSSISAMPVGGIIDITFGRGTYELINTGNHSVIIAAASITYSDFDLVP